MIRRGVGSMDGVIAAQLTAHGIPGKIELRDVPAPKPGPDEVVVEVQAAGLNRLDLWLEEGALPVRVALPRTPGGEVAGRVLECGSNVTGWRHGDEVAVQSNLFCGECEFCRRGDESLCLRGQLLGVNCDGGFAEQVLVPARSLVRLPAGVDFDTSAALTLAGSTAMHMLTNRAQVQPGEWVLVIGASSGVGSAAIQIAKGLGARVVTTASSEAKQAVGRGVRGGFQRRQLAGGSAAPHEQARRGFGDRTRGRGSAATGVRLPGARRHGGDVRRDGWARSADQLVAVFREATAADRQLRAQSRGHPGDARMGGRRAAQASD